MKCRFQVSPLWKKPAAKGAWYQVESKPVMPVDRRALALAAKWMTVMAAMASATRVASEGPWGGPSALLGFSPLSERDSPSGLCEKEDAAAREGPPRRPSTAALISLAVAALAVLHFAVGVKTRLSTGMTGFDSTWYHGPFAAGFFQSGDTWNLHFIAPQFLAWFYPANS